jgi:hypothetical protein
LLLSIACLSSRVIRPQSKKLVTEAAKAYPYLSASLREKARLLPAAPRSLFLVFCADYRDTHIHQPDQILFRRNKHPIVDMQPIHIMLSVLFLFFFTPPLMTISGSSRRSRRVVS